MDLTPEPLTPREQQLVEIERRRGVLIDGKLPTLREQHQAEWGGKARALARAWASLPTEGREFVAHALAGQARAAGGRPFEDVLDFGAAVAGAIDTIRGRRVAPVPGLREAVCALHQVWMERGHPGTVRHLHRDRTESGPRDGRRTARGPSDLHVFVAKHLIAIFGREPFSRHDDAQVLNMACIAADTALTGR